MIAEDSDAGVQEQGRKTLVYCILLLVAGIVAYCNSFEGSFLLDDYQSIINNRSIRQFPPNPHDLTRSPRPVVMMSLAFCYWLGGLNVSCFHVFNLVVHLAAAVTLFGVIRLTLLLPRYISYYRTRATHLAFAAAFLWTVHPLQTQSVTYIIQRSEALAGLFFLLTLYCFIRSVNSRQSIVWSLAALLCYVTGLLSKETAVTVPLAVILYDRVFVSPSFKHIIRRRWRFYLGMACVWIIPVVIWLNLVPINAGFGLKGITSLEYAMTQAGVILHYLRLSLWPDGLCFDYSDWPLTKSLSGFLPAGIAIVGLIIGSTWGLLKRSGLGYLGVCFFLVLVPSSSILPIRDVAFEYRMYLPLAALAILAVIISDSVLRWFFHYAHLPDIARVRIASWLVIVLGLSFVWLSIQRNRDYLSKIAMWSDVASKRPQNARAQCGLGHAYRVAGMIDRAIAHQTEALRLRPDYSTARRGLAISYLQAGQLEEALTHITKVTKTPPYYAGDHHIRGAILFRLEKFREAVDSFRQATRLAPRSYKSRFACAVALYRLGHQAEAKIEYETGLRMNPDWPQRSCTWAWKTATDPSSDRLAVESYLMWAQQAFLATEEHEPKRLDVLAAAYARLGQFDQAVRYSRRAIAAAISLGQTELGREIRYRLQLYETGCPFLRENQS